jgi:hypothetical protein
MYLYAYPDAHATLSYSSSSASSTTASSSENVTGSGSFIVEDLSNNSYVAGAILMSGTASPGASSYDPSTWPRVAANAGCRNATAQNNVGSTVDEDELACMRRIDASALRRAISAPNNTRVVHPAGTPRGGSPRPDNVTFFAPAALQQRLATGKVARVVRVYQKSFRTVQSLCGCFYPLGFFLVLLVPLPSSPLAFSKTKSLFVA